MGFSHGSQAALYGNTERFQQLYGSPDLQYAAYISVYGICVTSFRGDEGLLKPLLMLHGIADDWLPISKCREYAARLQKAGRKGTSSNTRTRIMHLIRRVSLSRSRFPQATSVSNCSLEEGDNGAILNASLEATLHADRPVSAKGYDGRLQRGSYEEGA